MTMRKDKQKRHDRLCELIQIEISEDGQEFENYKWAVRPRHVWAEMLGVDRKTISRLIKLQPIQTRDTLVEERRCVLLRVGEPGKKTFSHMANIMAKSFRTQTGRELSSSQWGMLNGLAEIWPEGYQVKIFMNLITPAGWNGFIHALDINIMNEIGVNGNTKLERKFLKHPSIDTLRRFPEVAQDAYKTHMKGEYGCVEPDYDYVLNWT